ncbi:MAG: hypothetical protein GEU88_01740 [Solirubrobacterales bacterium]|nr:hypothetical protein [Solirubrobacterales bacterium]
MRGGRYAFSQVTYDPPSDVLYARLTGADAARRERTREGDIWTYDEADRPTGVIVMEPRLRLERDGAVYLTMPTGERERLQGIEAELRVRPT